MPKKISTTQSTSELTTKSKIKCVKKSDASSDIIAEALDAKKTATKTKKSDKKKLEIIDLNNFDTSLTGNEILVTQEGLAKLKEELHYLEYTKKREIAQRLKDAIAYGDLSENSEYQEAKEEQAFVEGQILDLNRKIKYARIIADKHEGKVNLGSVVVLKNLLLDAEEKYTVVGATEVDPYQGLISNESPLGASVLGKKKGDSVTVKAPGGNFDYTILSIS